MLVLAASVLEFTTAYPIPLFSTFAVPFISSVPEVSPLLTVALPLPTNVCIVPPDIVAVPVPVYWKVLPG